MTSLTEPDFRSNFQENYMLKLPKSLQTPELELRLEKALAAQSRPLFDGCDEDAPYLSLNKSITDLLRSCRRAGHLVGGLEKITAQIGSEEQGFAALQKRGQANTPKSSTRILLLCDEGSERFYRDALRLCRRHTPWVGLVRLQLAPSECASLFFGSQTSTVKALLIDHKDWVKRFFETWLEDSSANE
jgi:hypothetical protein